MDFSVHIDTISIGLSISHFCNFIQEIDGEERAGCFAWFVFLVSRDGCVCLFLMVSWVCLWFVIVVSLDHTHYFRGNC